jgi:hypothetical protein
MEETLKELVPTLIQLESNTAIEVVRQVMIYKYIELGITAVIMVPMVFLFGFVLYKMLKD